MFISGARRRSLSGLTENTEITTSKNCLEATPAPPSNSKLVFSGGEGYVDFRIGLYQGQYLKMETCLKVIIRNGQSRDIAIDIHKKKWLEM